MNSFLTHDPTVWVALSFVIFVALAFKFGRASVLKSLDTRIESVRNDLATAEQLKAEAQALLAEYQRKQLDASKEAEQLIENARDNATRLQKQAEEDFTATMNRREGMMKERIQRMEETAMDDIRRYAAELAISATTQIIAEKMDDKSAQKLADTSIRNLSENLN
jgi:F-type H+-transporting ATPase subunit b